MFRVNLPAVLRTGRLIHNQMITFRDRKRRSIEGRIIYIRTYFILLFRIDCLNICFMIDHDGENCIAKRKEKNYLKRNTNSKREITQMNH